MDLKKIITLVEALMLTIRMRLIRAVTIITTTEINYHSTTEKAKQFKQLRQPIKSIPLKNKVTPIKITIITAKVTQIRSRNDLIHGTHFKHLQHFFSGKSESTKNRRMEETAVIKDFGDASEKECHVLTESMPGDGRRGRRRGRGGMGEGEE